MFKIYNRNTHNVMYIDNFEEFSRRYFGYIKIGYSELDVIIFEKFILVIMGKEDK